MLKAPRDRSLDSTLALLLDGYTYISKRCRKYQTDIFQTRLLFQKVICLMGVEATQLFYEREFFKSNGPTAALGLKTLLGQGGVQVLEDTSYHNRKKLFKSMMSSASVINFTEIIKEQWRLYMIRWQQQERVALFYDLEEIFCRAVCQWIGLPLKETEVRRTANYCRAILEGKAKLGLGKWQGRIAYNRMVRWLIAIIEPMRTKRLVPIKNSPLQIFVDYREEDGQLLDKKIVAAELINLICPLVAVARHTIFAAAALHEYPECRDRLRNDDDNYLELFVREVRRCYPFFPIVTAVVDHDIAWRGYRIPAGSWVIFDQYGTNHDPNCWENPTLFQPERFRYWQENPFNATPPIGAEHQDHRCVEEALTIELMKQAVHLLAVESDYDVLSQDLKINRTRMPAIPKDRFIITNVKWSQYQSEKLRRNRRVDSVVAAD